MPQDKPTFKDELVNGLIAEYVRRHDVAVEEVFKSLKAQISFGPHDIMMGGFGALEHAVEMGDAIRAEGGDFPKQGTWEHCADLRPFGYIPTKLITQTRLTAKILHWHDVQAADFVYRLISGGHDPEIIIVILKDLAAVHGGK